MKGPDLLLRHLELLDDEPAEPDERATARERLEAEVGPELAARLLVALTTPPR